MTKQTFEENRRDIERLKGLPVGGGRCTAMTVLNFLSSWHLFKKKYITAQPNTQPTFLHKFRQFYLFIQKLSYDNNLGGPAI